MTIRLLDVVSLYKVTYRVSDTRPEIEAFFLLDFDSKLTEVSKALDEWVGEDGWINKIERLPNDIFGEDDPQS